MNKKYIYLSVLILLAIFLLIGLFYYVSKNEKLEDQKKIYNAENLDIEKKDITKMSNNEIYSLIEEDGKKEYCKYMDSQHLIDLCLEVVAIKSKDLGICSEIKEENITVSCKNSVILQKATEENNISQCGELETEKKQQNCFNNLFNDQIIIQDCDKIVVKKTGDSENSWDEYSLNQYCKDMVNFREATKSKDVEKCNVIFWNPTRAQCLGQVQVIPLNSDNDNDGLKFLDEIIQGTEPDMADTDGDGYKDGDEVKNRYSPIDGN